MNATDAPVITEEQIDYMVNRFLSWKLPEYFSPDAGISFKSTFNESTAYPMKHEPTGTNLLDANQAKSMVRYILDGVAWTKPLLKPEFDPDYVAAMTRVNQRAADAQDAAFVRLVIDAVADAAERFLAEPTSVEQERIEIAEIIEAKAIEHDDAANEISDEAGGAFGDRTERDDEISMHKAESATLWALAKTVRARTPVVEEPDDEPKF